MFYFSIIVTLQIDSRSSESPSSTDFYLRALWQNNYSACDGLIESTVCVGNEQDFDSAASAVVPIPRLGFDVPMNHPHWLPPGCWPWFAFSVEGKVPSTRTALSSGAGLPKVSWSCPGSAHYLILSCVKASSLAAYPGNNSTNPISNFSKLLNSPSASFLFHMYHLGITTRRIMFSWWRGTRWCVVCSSYGPRHVSLERYIGAKIIYWFNPVIKF